ncbi:MAG: phosphate regulon sensor histidine kinase PhoR [Thalassotalea sp.]
MYLRLTAFSLYSRLVLWLLASLVIGYFVGYLWTLAFFVVFGILIWNYQQILKLVEWLWESKSLTPPNSEGVWGRIFDGLYRQVRRARIKQKRLNERIRQFRDGAEALPDAALVLSNEFIIEWGNKKAQKLLGIRTPGDVGQRIDNLLRFPKFSLQINEGNIDLPIHIPSPLDAEIQLELRLMPYGTDQILFLARDISKVHRLEEMRRDFVANVSHELKTPLTVVRGYVEMVQVTEHALDPHWKKAFNTIETQVTRMDRLVEQLLTLSRVEIHTEHDIKQKIDMPKLIHQLVEDASWLNQEKQHRISLDVVSSMSIKGIDTEIKSACSNLISNAIAYTPEHGDIHVSWQNYGDRVRFAVKDNGPGIKPEHVNRLTERFYRVDKSRSRNTGGSGLGLAIVKHVLQHHGAELIINSQWGEGTEFSIIFNKECIVP